MSFTFDIEQFTVVGRLTEKTKQKVVIIVHGFADTKDGRVARMFEEFFLENNYSTLTLDMPGAGESSGNYYDISPRFEAKVIHKSIDLLKAQGYKDISLCGHSLGGTDCAIVASEMKLHKVFLINPVVDPRETYGLCEKLGQFKRRVDADLEIFGVIVNARFLKAMPNLMDLSYLLKNIVIVQSENDEYCPQATSKLFFDLIADKSKKFLLINGANHNFTEEEMKASLREKLKEVI